MDITSISRPNVSDLQLPYEERAKNAARRRDNHTEECFLCGRGMTDKAFAKGQAVWLGTDGMLIPVDADNVPDSLDQGWFPVGSECIKRVPAAFRAQ